MMDGKTENRILVVDDDAVVRTLIEGYFTRKGYKVDSVENGCKALVLCTEKCFDVVISDLHMPGISGLVLAKWLKSNKHDTKIVLITGDTEAEVSTGLIDAVVYKPFKLEDLAGALCWTPSHGLQRE